MTKYLFKLIRICSIFAFLFFGASKSYAQDAQSVEMGLWETSQWIQQLLDNQGISITLQLIRIDDPAYQSFVQDKFKNSPHYDEIGQAALSALFEPYGQKNGKPSNTCFLLFNLKETENLKNQFFSTNSDDQGTYLFLIAHELSHCFELLWKNERKKEVSLAISEKLRSEIVADAYSVLLTTIITGKHDIISQIIRSREKYAKNSTHDTASAIRALLRNNNFKGNLFSGNIKELWFLVDNSIIDVLEQKKLYLNSKLD